MGFIGFRSWILIVAAIQVWSTYAEEDYSMLRNWEWTYEYKPAVTVQPTTQAEVAEIVRNTSFYPSPLRAYGSLYSPTECVVNAGGTVVMMRGLNTIDGLSVDSKNRTVVTAQAGVTLLEVLDWLRPHQLELPFMCLNGDATVGSMATSVSKDSGVGDPAHTGAFYKVVTGLTYVDHMGTVITLTEDDHPKELALFKSSDGNLGIVAAVTLLTVPANPVTNRIISMPTTEYIQGMVNGSFAVNEESNHRAYIQTEYTLFSGYVTTPPGTLETDTQLAEITCNSARQSIRSGAYPRPLKTLSARPIVFTALRSKGVNHYEPLEKRDEARGDGTWYEYPLEKFESVVTGYLLLVDKFKTENSGFEPTGAAVFWVRRIPEKPFGWFSQKGEGFDQPGLSFTLDPVTNTPNDLRWEKFLRQVNAFALEHGGRFSLSQTRFITREQFLGAPGQKPVPDTPNSRFTSAFFKQFVAPQSSDVAPQTAEVTAPSSLRHLRTE